MGTLRLECPLCCTETFPTTTALKYHLLNMIDNLLCTGCGKKFNSVRSLAEHLSAECKINKNLPNNEKDNKAAAPKDDDKLNEEDNDEEEDEADEGSDTNVQDAPIEVKVEQEDEDADMYHCSTCAISFANIEKHLEEFHEGQEVLLDEAVAETENDESELLLLKNTDDNADGPIIQTLQEEECTDKAGRLYTRKVVQIEKFWDEKEIQSRPEPIVQFFNVNEGIAVKVDKEDINNATSTAEGTSILQVFQCAVCSTHFTKEKQYQMHKCGTTKYPCSVCDASFPQRRSLNAHMSMHNKKKNAKGDNQGEGPHVCDFCSTPFNTYKSLRLHLRMHDPIKSKEVEPPVSYGIMGEDLEVSTHERVMFTCNICNKEYDEVYRHVHMKSHSEEENFDCETCNRKFFTRSNLEMHMRVHSAGKSHICSYCKEEFVEYQELQEHIKQHLETRPYQCQYCSRRFIRPHEKVKHERIHTGEKPHICEVCGKAFRVSYCLTLHMRTHSGTRPYQCQECGKRFKAHSVYNHHLLIHSNVRKYKCPYCPKAFKTAVQLAGHKNTHTKPFTCTECNRPFASLYAVRSHMETHKTENNLKYHCLACGASYARAFALRDHIKTIHGGGQCEEDLDPLTENSNATMTIMAENTIQNVLILDQDALVDTVEMVEEATLDN